MLAGDPPRLNARVGIGTLVIFDEARSLYSLVRGVVSMAVMAREEKSALGWFAFAISVAALALATFGLRSGSASGAVAVAASVDVTPKHHRVSGYRHFWVRLEAG